MRANEIRAKFLQFFESKEHKIVPSAPIVLKDDPSLLFTNAGMNQFKEYFLGHAQPQHRRVVDTQKVLRVSGKHNDLEEVGHDTYHHTMFEMMGNWSFGDYFKKKAIEYAWELLTEVYEIPKKDLYATVFEGDKNDGLGKDQKAEDIWRNILPEAQILEGDKEDNFWEMGAQGPCGPCSEIHVDIRSEEEKKKIPGRELVNKDHPLVVEIWNLVFMQFNRKADGRLEELPEKHVDTGMGFERLCMILQGKRSNYDTDVFTPLIRKVENLTGLHYEDTKEAQDRNVAIRVIVDHVRAVTFAIADGQLPGNNGAGYVIRRILRRAIRYGFTFLNIRSPFIYRLVDTLVKQMGEAFPELKRQQSFCENVIREEEQAFLKTLEQGLEMLDKLIKDTTSQKISGKRAFDLYDTYGFPVDLTALILKERGFSLDREEFETELAKQKNRSRSAAAATTEDWQILVPDQEEEFVGYDNLQTAVNLTRYRKITNKKYGEHYQLVFNLTPFYPEGGGQIGDQGYIESPDGQRVSIIDTRKENNLIVHLSRKLPDNVYLRFKAVVDTDRRARTRANHSATHLLHQALRKILGKHVEQKGSLVTPGKLRFDFSHFSKLTDAERQAVEDFVNARIKENLALAENRNIPYDKALHEGAIALFGEKYGDTVRTIRFGKSIELCGGTHVQNTGEIWYFKILNESGVASGVRRIEAITGKAVEDYFEKQEHLIANLKEILKNKQDVLKGVIDLQEKNTALKKKVERLQHDKASRLKEEIKAGLREIDGVKFATKKVEMSISAMKDLVYQLGGEVDNLFVLLGAEQKGKALLTCYISKDLTASKGLNAGKIVGELGRYIKGGGGGQSFFATAGGKDPHGIPKAFEEAESYLK